MTLRTLITDDPASSPRPSARVARIAELLDCDPKQVRRLVESGDLQAHGIGTRGLRVYLDSVADYQAGRQRQARPAPEKPQKTRAVDRAAQAHAERELRRSGILS